MRGYEGSYTVVTDMLREIRRTPVTFKVRFESRRRSTLLISVQKVLRCHMMAFA